ncbi:MAG TPA: asparagine synthase C-terminal domain-containing protein, partial [Puia sp.]|nr:asparagine synthase C-terminal domain-containing protein [Puia sp.]
RVYALAADSGIKVLLDGQGADELMAGYPRYFMWYWRELYRARRGSLAPELAAARLAGITETWTWRHRLAGLFPGYAATFQSRRRRLAQRTNRDLSRDFVKEAGTSYYHLPPVARLNEALRYNSLSNGLEELLRYADRNSMAHGVEIRLPFLDHRLAEFLFSLPARYKIRDGWTKWLLRTCAASLLPAEIAWRKDKIGFEPPQSEWMADKRMAEYVMEGRRKLVAHGVLDRTVMQKKIQPMAAHAAENFDWKYLVAAVCLY